MLKHHVDIVAFAGNFPDGRAKLTRFFEPRRIFGSIHCWHLPPAVEILAVQHALGTQPHNEITLALIRDHPDGIGARSVDQLDCVRAKTTRGTPDQDVLTRLQIMRLVAKQHPVGGRQCERVAGGLFPGQVLGARHQLLGLHIGELGKGPIRCLIAPDPLAGRIHRVATVAFLVVAVILVAVNDNLIADFPALDLVTNRPNDTRGIGPSDVVGRFMPVKRRDRLPQRGPNAIVVNASGHHQNQNIVAVQLRDVDHFLQHCAVRLTMALFANGPCVHFLGNIAHRGHFTDLIQVLFGSLIRQRSGLCVQSHGGLLFERSCCDAESRLLPEE